jgi:hypothetical protein
MLDRDVSCVSLLILWSTDLVQEPRTFSAYEYIAVLRTFSKSYRGIIKLIGTLIFYQNKYIYFLRNLISIDQKKVIQNQKTCCNIILL